MQSHWKENTIDVNGVKVHYTRTGDGSKPPVVLAHGFSDNGLCWMPTACDLESDYDVIMPDARGHGLSQRIDPQVETDQAGDLAGLITTLGLDHPVVGGHSMGGSTASAMEARFPGLAKALILEDPGWHTPTAETQEKPAEPPRNPWFEWLQALPNKTVEEVMADGKRDNPTWPDNEFGAWAESKKQLDLHVLTAPRRHVLTWQEAVMKISVPTLLLTADNQKGSIVTPEIVEFARANPNIITINIPGVGHNIRRENLAAFLIVVRGFLQKVA